MTSPKSAAGRYRRHTRSLSASSLCDVRCSANQVRALLTQPSSLANDGKTNCKLDAEYTFKHALVQDAAYSTSLRSRRQQIHARIVQVLEEQVPATSETGCTLLAHHCTHAGFVEKAISYRHRAAQTSNGTLGHGRNRGAADARSGAFG